jgi:hypothetical protein
METGEFERGNINTNITLFFFLRKFSRFFVKNPSLFYHYSAQLNTKNPSLVIRRDLKVFFGEKSHYLPVALG